MHSDIWFLLIKVIPDTGLARINPAHTNSPIHEEVYDTVRVVKQSIGVGIYSTNHVLRHQVQHRFTLPIVSQRSNLIKNYHAVNIQGVKKYGLLPAILSIQIS